MAEDQAKNEEIAVGDISDDVASPVALEGDDLMTQASDAGKASVEFGKKAGKFLFNATKLGFQKLANGAKKLKENIDKEKERMAEWPDARLAREAKTKMVLPSGMAAMQILKERGYSGTDIANM